LEILQIINGCRRKEAQWQKVLYERFFGYALKIAFRYVYRYDDAVDVTNDGFVKVFLHFERFRYEERGYPERLLMAWIKRIVINTAIDALRKDRLVPEMGTIPEYVWEETDSSQNADQLLLFKEVVSHVKNLPPMYRIVFNMFVLDGCSHVEIAGRMGISVGTSKSNLSRARAILQKIIMEREGEVVMSR
jgi:RNA polymerase sigma factor (sigma-70 family)